MSSSTVTPSSPLSGSCFCGTLKYELSAPPLLRAYCHCTQCQRLSGTPPFYIPCNTDTLAVCAQVLRSFIPCTSPRLPSHGFRKALSTPSSTQSDRGRHSLAVAHVVSRSFRITYRNRRLVCGAPTLRAMKLGVCCAGTKCDLLRTYFTGHGCWM
jgi:hypothetical protein